MSTGKLQAITIFLFLSLFSVPVFAVPCAFDGTVKIDDKIVDPSLITVYLNDTNESVNVEHLTDFESTGFYVINIGAGDEYIKFKIADLWISGEYFCDTTVPNSLNLSATSLGDGESCTYSESCSGGYCVLNFCRSSSIYCGDNVCDTGEDCTSCLSDCPCQPGQICSSGACLTPSGPLPSGGGGGVYIPPKKTCNESWTCTDWSACVSGTQTRTCTDLNNCNTTKSKPNETQSCIAPLAVCGNGILESGEECETDVTCTMPDNYAGIKRCTNCILATCTPTEYCGDGICNGPETSATCTADCPAGAPITSLFLGLTTMDWVTAIAAGIIIAIILIVLFRKRKSKK